MRWIAIAGAGLAVFLLAAGVALVVAGAGGSEGLSVEPVVARQPGCASSRLEADRALTQRMAGPSNERMTMTLRGGVLARSSNPAYLRCLEQSMHEVDAMLGRMPWRLQR